MLARSSRAALGILATLMLMGTPVDGAGAASAPISRTYTGHGEAVRFVKGVSRYYAFTVGSRFLPNRHVPGGGVLLHSFSVSSGSRELLLQLDVKGHPNVLLAGRLPAARMRARHGEALVGYVVFLKNFLTGKDAGSLLLSIGGKLTRGHLEAGAEVSLGLLPGVVPGTQGSYRAITHYKAKRLHADAGNADPRFVRGGTYTGKSHARFKLPHEKADFDFSLEVDGAAYTVTHYVVYYPAISCKGGVFPASIAPGSEAPRIHAQIAPDGSFVSHLTEPEYYTSGRYGGERQVDLSGTFRRTGNGHVSVSGSFDIGVFVSSGPARGAVCAGAESFDATR